MNKTINGKTVLKVLLNLIVLAIGTFFLLHSVSDIQLSAGVILLAIGFNGLLSV